MYEFRTYDAENEKNILNKQLYRVYLVFIITLVVILILEIPYKYMCK